MEVNIASNIDTAIVAMMVQSINILSLNAEALTESVNSMIIDNPLLEMPPYTVQKSQYNLLEAVAARKETLTEHLLFQLHVTKCPVGLMALARFLIGNLDCNGYLRDDIVELAQFCGTSEHRMLEALYIVQTLEPEGVGARNLSECLLLQLKAQQPSSTLAIEIVTCHLEELGRGNLNLPYSSDADIQKAIKLILSLNPRPGTEYDADDTQYVLPDIQFFQNNSGAWKASLINQPVIPVVSSMYKEYLKASNENQRQYVQDNLESARNFIHAVSERSKTLLRVANYIAAAQSLYLSTLQQSDLRPLKLTAVSNDLNLSLSTISRTVSDKYAQTPNGTINMRKLFTSGGSADYSREYIIGRISQLKSTSVINDREICDLLNREGIKISRRTVNKYKNIGKEMNT